MKSLINKTLAALLMATCLLVTIPSQANHIDSLKRSEDKALKMSAIELAELIASLEDDSIDLGDDSITYEFYNSADELLLRKTVSPDQEVADKQFITLKRKSDVLVEIGQTTIYMLNEQ